MEGVFQVQKDTQIVVSVDTPELQGVARQLVEYLKPATGFRLDMITADSQTVKPNSILLTTHLADPGLGAEGYELVVQSDYIIMRAPHSAGLFYATQTLRQLLPSEIHQTTVCEEISWTVPCMWIVDQPRFVWRGFMLDSCRHYQSPEFILHLLDVMAFYKLNRFHWHLSEDQAWRIELTRYPKLTEIGAWRGKGADRYGGFYSSKDIRRILDHARALHITVIPEIEMPGHTTAALVAYPEYSCSGGPFEPGDDPGLGYFTSRCGRQAYCAGKESTFVFLENILSDVMELFDTPYIHIGGDERPENQWTQCPQCQKRMAHLGLADESQLQNWFMKRINGRLLQHHRRSIAWAENMEGGVPEYQIVQAWRTDEAKYAVQKAKRFCVHSYHQFCYLDYPCSEEERSADQYWMPLLELKKMYSWDPVPEGLTPEEAHRILGPEACLWTELVPQERVHYQAFPRLLVTCELGWSFPCHKDYADFCRRLIQHLPRLQHMDIRYNSHLSLINTEKEAYK